MEIDERVRREIMDRLASPGAGRRRRARMRVGLWEMTVRGSYLVKRLVDLVGSAVGIVLLSPVFLILAAAVFIDDPGPVFYLQTRVGRDGRHFRFIKFRSMIRNADKVKDVLAAQNESGDGVIFKMKRDPRITRVGRFIRRMSLDELPQLVNVLKGDMSLVGPRPPLPREVALYSLEDRKRLHVIPGITGIWQVSGRSEIPFKQQVQLDLLYIRSQSLRQDLVILLKTIPAVLTSKGAY